MKIPCQNFTFFENSMQVVSFNWFYIMNITLFLSWTMWIGWTNQYTPYKYVFVCNGDGIRLNLKLDWALILLRKIYKLKSLQI